MAKLVGSETLAPHYNEGVAIKTLSTSLAGVGWDQLVNQILGLRADRVSPEVKARSLTFLRSYLDHYRTLCEPADISADGENGLVIDWKQDGRFLEAVWPESTDQPPYLYFSTASEFGTEEPLTPVLLQSRLDWLRVPA